MRIERIGGLILHTMHAKSLIVFRVGNLLVVPIHRIGEKTIFSDPLQEIKKERIKESESENQKSKF